MLTHILTAAAGFAAGAWVAITVDRWLTQGRVAYLSFIEGEQSDV